MNEPRKFARKWELLILLIVAIISFVAIMLQANLKEGNASAEIFVDGALEKTIQLDNSGNMVFSLESAPTVVVEVRDGKVGIISSDCPDKLCIRFGFISRHGQQSICLPNKVVIKIVSGDSGADAVL